MADDELRASANPPGRSGAVQVAASPDLVTPAATGRPDGLDGSFTRVSHSRPVPQVPVDSGYCYVGRRFSIAVTPDLDVEFDFDFDPDPAALEEPDRRIGLLLLILIVWCLAARLGAAPADDPRSAE